MKKFLLIFILISFITYTMQQPSINLSSSYLTQAFEKSYQALRSLDRKIHYDPHSNLIPASYKKLTKRQAKAFSKNIAYQLKSLMKALPFMDFSSLMYEIELKELQKNPCEKALFDVLKELNYLHYAATYCPLKFSKFKDLMDLDREKRKKNLKTQREVLSQGWKPHNLEIINIVGRAEAKKEFETEKKFFFLCSVAREEFEKENNPS
jgi:hypothetical protein